MSPPRLIWGPTELPTLECPSCDAPPPVAVPVPPALDRYVVTLPDSARLAPIPFRGLHLFNIEWGRMPTLAPHNTVAPLFGAYIASEPLAFIDFVPGLAGLADGIERLDLDFFNIPVNRGGGHCRFSEYSPRTERVHDCNVDITAGTTARAHGEIRPIRGSDESLITRVVVDFSPNLLNHSIVTLEIDGFAAVDSPGFIYDRSFPGRHRESVLSWPLGDTGYENPLGSRDGLMTPFDSEAAPPPDGRHSWMFRFSPVVGDVIDLLAQAVGERQIHLWAYLPTAGLTDPQSYEALGIPYNTFPRRFGDVIRLLSPLFSRASREALRHAGPYYNPNSEYLDMNGRRQAIPDDPEALAAVNREREAYNRAHPDEAALPAIVMNRGPVLDWVFTDLLSDPHRLAALFDADPAALPRVTSRIRFNETHLELPFGNLTVAEGSEAEIQYGLQVERRADGEIASRAFGRLTLSPIEIRDIDLEIRNYVVQASRLCADRVVIHAPNLGALFSGGRIEPQDGLQIELSGVHLEGLRLADRRIGLGGELGSADLGELHFTFHSGAWHLEIGEGESAGIEITNLAIQTLLGEVSFDRASIPEVDARWTARHGSHDAQVTVTVPEVRSASRMAFAYYPRHSSAPLRLSLEGSSTLSNLRYFYHADEAIQHQARFDVEATVREARIEHEMLGSLLLSTLRSPDSELTDPMRGRVQLRIRNPGSGEAEESLGTRLEPDINLELPFMAIGAEGSALSIPRETSTIEHGRLNIHADRYSVEGILNIADARLHSMGNGRLEFGDSVIAAEDMAIGLSLSGPASFAYSPEGWRLEHTPGATAPLDLGMTINDLGFIHFNDPSFLPPGIPRDPVPEVFQTRLHIANAAVSIRDFRALYFERFREPEGAVRGRLTRLESGPITAHHIEGSGAIWAPLAIWGMIRGLFPVLGHDASETAPTRPDPAPLVAHLPTETMCELGDGDFFRLGGVDYRYYPLTDENFVSRRARSLRSEAPRGDWEARIDDLIINLHEASVPGGPRSRSQYVLMRIPEAHVGRLWTDDPRWHSCPAAAESSDAVCGEERTFWNLGIGDFLGSFYLNDPQRGGSFLFRRGLASPPEHGLSELLNVCPAP